MAELIRLLENNDGDAIQKAIDALPDGGLIMLGPGEYAIGKTILLKNDITIKGSGCDKTQLILKDHADCHIMTNDNHRRRSHNIKLCDLGFDGNMHKQKNPEGKSPLLYSCGAYFKNVDGIHIENIKAINIHQTAFHFNECRDVSIDGLDADYMGWSGISTSGTDNIVVTRTHVDRAGFLSVHSGIHIDGGEGVYLETRVSGTSGNAVMLDSAYRALHNVVVNCEGVDSKRGLSLSGSIKNPMENVTVGGRYAHNKEIGILVSNASNVFIINCRVEHNPEYGILLQGRQGAIGCIVSRNVFENNGIPIGEVHESKYNYFTMNQYFGNKSETKLKKRVERVKSVRNSASKKTEEIKKRLRLKKTLQKKSTVFRVSALYAAAKRNLSTPGARCVKVMAAQLVRPLCVTRDRQNCYWNCFPDTNQNH